MRTLCLKRARGIFDFSNRGFWRAAYIVVRTDSLETLFSPMCIQYIYCKPHNLEHKLSQHKLSQRERHCWGCTRRSTRYEQPLLGPGVQSYWSCIYVSCKSSLTLQHLIVSHPNACPHLARNETKVTCKPHVGYRVETGEINHYSTLLQIMEERTHQRWDGKNSSNLFKINGSLL